MTVCSFAVRTFATGIDSLSKFSLKSYPDNRQERSSLAKSGEALVVMCPRGRWADIPHLRNNT